MFLGGKEQDKAQWSDKGIVRKKLLLLYTVKPHYLEPFGPFTSCYEVKWPIRVQYFTVFVKSKFKHFRYSFVVFVWFECMGSWFFYVLAIVCSASKDELCVPLSATLPPCRRHYTRPDECVWRLPRGRHMAKRQQNNTSRPSQTLQNTCISYFPTVAIFVRAM